jgi:hypothetical protein
MLTPVDYLRGAIWQLLTKLLAAQVWVDLAWVSLGLFSILAQVLVEMAISRKLEIARAIAISQASRQPVKRETYHHAADHALRFGLSTIIQTKLMVLT